jgi:hypothetical protein
MLPWEYQNHFAGYWITAGLASVSFWPDPQVVEQEYTEIPDTRSSKMTVIFDIKISSS